MRVHDWMSPDPVTTTTAVKAADARRLMHRYGIRHLPVVRSGRVVGMISDRDVRSAFPGANVGAVMSTPPQVIHVDATTEEAARLMLSRRISALPVLDDASHMVGLITTTDCLLASLAPLPA